PRVFSLRVDSAESQPMPLGPASVLSVSRSGELALLTDVAAKGKGKLARVLLGGAGVREVASDVFAADWSPDGRALAIVRSDGRDAVLEYPVGTALHRWPINRSPQNVRVSPDGALLAATDLDGRGGGALTLLDTSGRLVRRSRHFPGIGEGMAWTSEGSEVWFSASEFLGDFNIYSLRRDGIE